MSILSYSSTSPTEVDFLKPEINKGQVTSEKSAYQPSGDEKDMRQEILRAFTLGHVNMFKPRREFNDLSLISRNTVDKMSFNTYQPNDGDPIEGDEINGWRSNAVKPIIRNKIMSIAAHATARLLFPKVFAYNQNDDEEVSTATVLESLMEWAADQSNYNKLALNAVITALWSPASIVHTDYVETYREVKREKVNGKWTKEKILDENLSGFVDEIIPVDQLYIENFYEEDIQKQGWLLLRKVKAYSLARAQYEIKYPNFKFVQPNIQIVYNDANQTFYDVYDTNMRQYMVEEITFWRKSDDLKVIMVNGVLLTDADNPNPRNDKMYPFDKFFYSPIDEGRCFYGKSLAFHMGPEAKLVNTLYPMIVDGTYLTLMPPMANIGGEEINSSVIIPGSVTTLTDPNAKLQPIMPSINLNSGMNTLFKVEESISQGSVEPIMQGADQGGDTTAYQISRQEQNAATVLGLFVKMIAGHVRAFGKLRLGDILQYLTLAEASDITSNSELTYKTFFVHDKMSGGKSRTRKIKFDMNMPDGEISPEEMMSQSYGILKEQGGISSKTELFKVNPALIRKIKYVATISPDILNPMSEEMEKAFKLEEYDRAIMNPLLDQEEVTKEFLLGAYPQSKKNPDKYFNKNAIKNQAPIQGRQSGKSPVEALSEALPQSAPTTTL